MAHVRPIKTEPDRVAALARIDALMDLDDRCAADSEELAVLAELVEAYERKHFPIELPTVVEAIRFRMEQLGLEPRDLAPHIGSRGKVSEVLSGKQPLSLAMIRALHKNLGIPAEVLLQEQAPKFAPSAIHDDLSLIEWKRLPLLEMSKRGWCGAVNRLREKAEEIGRELLTAAGGQDAVPAPLGVEATIGAPMRKPIHMPCLLGQLGSWVSHAPNRYPQCIDQIRSLRIF